MATNKILGHADIKMTMRCAHPTPRTCREQLINLLKYSSHNEKK